MVAHGSMQCGALLQPRHPYSVDDYRPRAAAGRSQPQDPHPLPGLRLIQLEGHRLVLHAVLGDDADLHRVAGVDVTLAGGHKGVLDEVQRLLLGERSGGALGRHQQRAGGLELVVQHRLNEVLARALARVADPLKRADGIVREDGALPLVVHAADEVEGVVGEEPLVVQRVAQQLRHSGAAHGLVVAVLVHHLPRGEQLLQRLEVGLEARGGNHALGVERLHAGVLPREDGVAGRQAHAGGNDAVVLPRHSHGGPAIIVVWAPGGVRPVLPRRLLVHAQRAAGAHRERDLRGTGHRGRRAG
mmetsp:Transcript_46629/g.118977  ORF Transcript_46629/g.118977 Transcript_46629/m.118977 type:complete len:301 (+) Transcript_46629:71-973(+)